MNGPRWRKKKLVRLMDYAHWLLSFSLKMTGLYNRGKQNALNVQINYHHLEFNKLPEVFNGLKILFMSDFHLGECKFLPNAVIDVIKGIDVDLCLLGGDYRYCMKGPISPVLEAMKKILTHIHAPMGIFGVRGNHDSIELAGHLESLGIKMLINSSVKIKKNGAEINLVGVDDPYYHETHNLKQAYSDVDEEAFSIFLAHTPQLFREVAERNTPLYLCGHTHNGQIRLPYLGSILTHSNVPKDLTQGLWYFNGMTGYTAAGVGTSGTNVRFLCPPEVTIFQLNKKPGMR